VTVFNGFLKQILFRFCSYAATTTFNSSIKGILSLPHTAVQKSVDRGWVDTCIQTYRHDKADRLQLLQIYLKMCISSHAPSRKHKALVKSTGHSLTPTHTTYWQVQQNTI